MSTEPISEPKTARKRPKRAPAQTLSVRMYDVGFGDCFLLSIPRADGKKLKILFDCGSIKNGPAGTPIKTTVQRVIQDVQDAPGEPARIDVVVATHRHKDHIVGFDDPAWADVEVGEVWMPWTEKLDDKDTQKIRELHFRLAEQLELRLGKALAEAPNDMKLASGHEMALNALSNDGAMRTLYQGFAGQPIRRYLPEKEPEADWFTTPILPGVTIYVLGPSRDPDVIGELEPPAGQSY